MSSHPVIKSQGRLVGYLSDDQTVRASVVEMTEMVEDLSQMLSASPSSSVAVGRLLLGTVLVASQLKDQQALSMQVSGSKSIQKIFAHAQYDGLCRAYISEKQAPLSLENNVLSLKPLIGDGLLQVVTYIPQHKQPSVSKVELQSGEIGEDIAYYLNQSQQIPCLISLAVKIGHEGRVIAAGGVLIELMPGHTEETLRAIESHQRFALPLSTLIEERHDFESLLRNHLGDISMREVRSHAVDYGCTCSKKKASQSLRLLPKADFEEILESQETLNVDCEMCGLTYQFDFTEINMVYLESGKANVH
jgi:molecular chaperone Hsp33